MSDILLKSIHFPQLDARYIVGDDTLSTEGAAADAKETGDALALKADKTDTYTKAQVDDKVGDAKTELEEAIDDLEENKLAIDGYSELATVGNSLQLVATQHITDTEPYNYRKTGGPNDVGDRVYDTLVGGSVVWNQLVNSGDTEVTVPNWHKYYANINGTKSIGASTGTAISINDSTKDNVIDLTAALGSTIADYVYSLETATAGAGVAWFKKYFPGIYYGYAEPHFEHVQTSGKVTIGFNRFDEQMEEGIYGISNGKVVKTTGAGRIRCTNPIPVFPNTTYHYSGGGYGAWIATMADEEGNGGANVASSDNAEFNFTTPSNAHYVVFHPRAGYGSAYKGDICINIHGDRDGEYEAYRKRTYPIEPKVLRGVPKLDSANRLYFDGDIYRHDGSGEQRYDIATYENLQFVRNTEAGMKLYRTINCSGVYSSNIINVFGIPAVPNFNSATETEEKIQYAAAAINNNFYILFSATRDLTNFVMVYEKATPEPFAAEPFQSPMVVDPLGTEAFVDYGVEEGDRDVAIPVGHESEYPADLRGKLQHLPSLSTSGDGRYVVVQTGNQMTLSPDTSLGLIAALEARVAALEGGNG